MESGGHGLARAFAEAMRSDARSAASPEELETLLRAVVERCRRAWPSVEVAPEVFVAFLAARIDARCAPLDQSLEQVHCEDLWLVCAACQRHPWAVQAVADLLADVVRGTLGARSPLGGDAQAEILQQLQTRLWVGDTSQKAALGTYEGRASLRSWLSMVVLRESFRTKQPAAASLEEEMVARLAAEQPTAEAAYLNREVREAMRQAVRDAIAELKPRDRNLLRYQIIDGLRHDEIAQIYRVNRTTVWRWLTRLETRLAKRSRLALGRILGASGTSEIDSLVRSLHSRLSITITDLLQPRKSPLDGLDE
jgi:RNA polymerase sigma-70 factor (ECF subfamily)